MSWSLRCGLICLMCVATLILIGCSNVGTRTPDTERTFGTVMQDVDITGRVNTAFWSDPLIDNYSLNVNTYQGVVTLTGNLPDENLACRAVEIAFYTQGVTNVINDINITPAMS